MTSGQKRRRLSRSAEFDRVYRHGRSVAGRQLVLYAFPRGDGGAGAVEGAGAQSPGLRLGVSVGRRVGGAVVRNRVKRLMREAFWSLAEQLPPDNDFVIVARAEARALAEREGSSGLARELGELIERLNGGEKGDAGAS